ncbi:ABC transporter ATP-binding protein [Marinilabiliaceae bacterium JC017]|nr:ABC transporter ATP-binding protein [Marinilabiliaceae bacterium JC017]
MQNNAIIEVRHLKKDYLVGNEIVHALRGVDLSIYPGDFVAIMGASGSGKSTMLNILGCLDKPTEGDYILEGINVKSLNKNQLAEIRNLKLGFVFQSYNLLPRTSALENVELPLLYNPVIKAKERRARAEAALESVGLADRMNHLSNQLSGGQQQRVAIARSIVNDPVIILADEATGNLDSHTSYEIMALFQELNSQGITIAFVTHEPDIAAFTSRNVLFRDGVIIKDSLTQNHMSAREALKAMALETHPEG